MKSVSALGSLGIEEPRQTMNRKPVIVRDAGYSLNVLSRGFKKKLLCDGPVLNLGDACAFSCSFCYVESIQKGTWLQDSLKTLGADTNLALHDVVIRRKNAVEMLRGQLIGKRGPRYTDPADRRVVFASSLVDIAANVTLLKESAAAIKLIMEHTHWHVRLLSKSPLIMNLVRDGMVPDKYLDRLIFGLSTGTLNDGIAHAIELGTPLVSKRVDALRWLQDQGLRTYGMVCPSLPQENQEQFSKEVAEAIRVDRCEHVWAEPINVRDDSFTRTYAALKKAGLNSDAERLAAANKDFDPAAWEKYARETFLAHKKYIPGTKLRYLQYVTAATRPWWENEAAHGAVLLAPVRKNTAKKSAGFATAMSNHPLPSSVANRNLTKSSKVAVLQPTLLSKDEELIIELEQKVTRALKASVEAARALYQIYTFKGGAYWRRDHKSFEAYCRARWGYQKAHCYRLLGTGEFVAALIKGVSPHEESPNGDSWKGWYPVSEAQVRPLLKLPIAHRFSFWTDLVTHTPSSQLTAKTVAEKSLEYAKENKLPVAKARKPRAAAAQRVRSILRNLSDLVKELPDADKLQEHIRSMGKLL